MKTKLLLIVVFLLTQSYFSIQSQTYLLSFVPEGTGKCGYINLKGDVIVEAQYTRCQEFRKEGAALVTNKKYSKFLFFDKTGKNTLPETSLKIYADPWSGVPSLYNSGVLVVKQNGKWGGIDFNEKLIVSAVYDKLTEFFDGFALGEKDKNFLVVYNKGNETHIDGYKIIYIKHFSGGLAPVEVKGQNWGYVNTSGEMAIKPRFKTVGYFNGDYAWARSRSGDIGFINKKGEWVVEPQFGIVQNGDPVSGIALAKKSKADAKYGYVFMNGDFKHFEMADRSYDFSEGLALAKAGVHFGYLDTRGQWAIDPVFDQARDFKNGYAAVKQNGRWGIIDKNGSFVLQPQYKELGDVSVVW